MRLASLEGWRGARRSVQSGFLSPFVSPSSLDVCGEFVAPSAVQNVHAEWLSCLAIGVAFQLRNPGFACPSAAAGSSKATKRRPALRDLPGWFASAVAAQAHTTHLNAAGSWRPPSEIREVSVPLAYAFGSAIASRASRARLARTGFSSDSIGLSRDGSFAFDWDRDDPATWRMFSCPGSIERVALFAFRQEAALRRPPRLRLVPQENAVG